MHLAAPEDTWCPATDAERQEIREQLDRLLSSRLFCQSKRYPMFLQYVVEQTLQGKAENLKERTLGIEVFHRDAAYDTNADPVVRVAAGEIRKRLAQYYYEDGHENEIRIEIGSGSYVPAFRLPARVAPAVSETEPTVLAATAPVLLQRPRSSSRWLGRGAILAAVLLLSCFFLYRRLTKPSQLDQFWSAVVDSNGPVVLCLIEPPPDPVAHRISSAQEGSPPAPGSLFLSDVVIMTKIRDLLEARMKKYRLTSAGLTDVTELRSGPLVLIGNFHNPWAVRLTQPLRYSFEVDPSAETTWIRDKQSTSQRNWETHINTHIPNTGVSAEDYGIVARVMDRTVDRPVIIIEGAGPQGTAAAGEVVTNPEYMSALLRQAPRNWQGMNVEAVIGVQVIDGKPGPPRIVAASFSE
jgi:hypothetical protein